MLDIKQNLKSKIKEKEIHHIWLVILEKLEKY